jgi:hypothetical protein
MGWEHHHAQFPGPPASPPRQRITASALLPVTDVFLSEPTAMVYESGPDPHIHDTPHRVLCRTTFSPRETNFRCVSGRPF